MNSKTGGKRKKVQRLGKISLYPLTLDEIVLRMLSAPPLPANDIETTRVQKRTKKKKGRKTKK
jgi:hypothetical protein